MGENANVFTKWELDTPALLVDLNAMEKNLETMARYCREKGINLRPHSKTYKAIPFFAWMQLKAGAIGITVSKLTEAETLAASGVSSILIANQIVGRTKIKRLANLCAYTDTIAATDCLENIGMISEIASAQGVKVGLLVEVDIGNNRCGAGTDEAVELAQAITRLQGVEFRGIMGYDGHLVFLDDKEKDLRSAEAYKKLAGVKEKLESMGIPVGIVSGSGSGTYKSATTVNCLTELQAGTYLFNDTTYKNKCLPEFECVLSIMATVISMKRRPGFENMAILNLGNKCVSLNYGFPPVKSHKGEIFSMPQEHCRIRFSPDNPDVKVGDPVEIYVSDSNNTFNLYEHVYLVRGDLVVAKIEVYSHGKTT